MEKVTTADVLSDYLLEQRGENPRTRYMLNLIECLNLQVSFSILVSRLSILTKKA